ncbi:GNAT family protein [Photobacterium sp. SP02]|uniref:GNAT family N-acetyltransferase n=1 Tax=Photobacterium sp. SP02 TaxID=3032280 RepID=UPI0031450B61
MFVLPTPRLALTDFLPSDTDAYLAMAQDEKYQRFYSEQDCNEKTMRDLVTLFVEQARERPRAKYQLAIRLAQGKEPVSPLIGTAGLRIDNSGDASVGCGLLRACHGQGIAEEAMIGLVNFGFEDLGIHRVYAETLAANKAAIALCRRLGMIEAERLHSHRYFKGRWWDVVTMEMDLRRWKKTGLSFAAPGCGNSFT